MQQIELVIEEEQETGITIGSVQYAIRLFAFRNMMYIDISVNNQDIVLGKRVISNSWLVPDYATQGEGNMRFECYKADGKDHVWWEQFNTKFRLTTYTKEEIEEMDAKEETTE